MIDTKATMNKKFPDLFGNGKIWHNDR